MGESGANLILKLLRNERSVRLKEKGNARMPFSLFDVTASLWGGS